MTAVAPKQETKVATVPKNLPDVTRPREPSVMDLMAMALEKGGDAVAQIERLVDMKIKLDDRAAAQEFAQAMAAFQAECPPIAKTSTAKIMSKRTGSTHSYNYAELDEIARTVNPILSRHGLSYSWDTVVEAKALKCVCTVRHTNGHSMPASISLPIDSEAAMSDQQKVKAAMTFGQRCSLISALGITTADPDRDGADGDTMKLVSDDQALAITDALSESGIDKGRFLAWLGVAMVSEVPAERFTSVMQAIEQKRREKAKAGR